MRAAKAAAFALLCSCVLVLGCGHPARLDESGGQAEALGQGLETLDFREVVSSAKQKVFPAVIYIRGVRESHESGRRQTEETGGSGFLISAGGEALTNWHVVDKAVELRCLLMDGRAFDARVVGSDKDIDLALIQLDLPEGAAPLPYARLGESARLTEGDFVMAMGAPWGLARSVSIGIVSCVNRYLPRRSEYSLWLQTDASISPGNSGGPLVNTDGEVVGVNSLAILRGGDMGFAVPSDTVALLLPQLRNGGRIHWSWTGLQLQPLRDFDRNIFFPDEEGVMVAGTDPASPARQAGILPQDRLLSVAGTPVQGLTSENLPDVRRFLGSLPTGEPVEVSLVRDGKPLSLEITPMEKGEVEGEELDCPRWDFTVKAINQFENPGLHFYREEGVFVFGTKYPGNAANAGIREQDILLEIDGREVTTLDDVQAIHREALENIHTRHRVVLTVLRRGIRRQIVLDFSRDFQRQ